MDDINKLERERMVFVKLPSDAEIVSIAKNMGHWEIKYRVIETKFSWEEIADQECKIKG